MHKCTSLDDSVPLFALISTWQLMWSLQHFSNKNELFLAEIKIFFNFSFSPTISHFHERQKRRRGGEREALVGMANGCKGQDELSKRFHDTCLERGGREKPEKNIVNSEIGTGEEEMFINFATK